MLRSRQVIVGGTAAIVAVFVAVLAVRHFQPGKTHTVHAQSTAIPVMAVPAANEDVPIILRGLGTVTAFNTVAVKSRVEGSITAIHFSEGQEVKAGDLLIELDARPFQAALDQANAAAAAGHSRPEMSVRMTRLRTCSALQRLVDEGEPLLPAHEIHLRDAEQ